MKGSEDRAGTAGTNPALPIFNMYQLVYLDASIYPYRGLFIPTQKVEGRNTMYQYIDYYYEY